MGSSVSRKVPDCPYPENKGRPCLEFDFKTNVHPVCSGWIDPDYTDDDEVEQWLNGTEEVKTFRCPLLPSRIKDGFHGTRYYDGRLHV